MKNNRKNRAAVDTGKKEPEFNPATASVLSLLGNGFVGTVLEFDQLGGKPTRFQFVNAATGLTTSRTLPRGMCPTLEQAFIEANFDPITAPLAALIEKGFKGAVLSLGEVGGKPSRLTFTHGTATVVREFPRGMCKHLEDGFAMRQGVRMRARPALRTR